MHSVQGNRWMMILLLTTILGTVYQEVSAVHGPVRVTRSAVESLRDRGTYIVHFKDQATEEELQQFTATLRTSSAKENNYTAEIIEEMFIIKCLTARVSRRALSWVRTVIKYVSNCVIALVPCDHCLINKKICLGYTSQDSSECKRK